MEKKFNFRKRIGVFCICSIVLVSFFVATGISRYNLSIVMSESINPKIIIWEDFNDGIVHNGDYIVFKWTNKSDPLGLKEGDLLTKRIFCNSGQSLTKNGDQFFCENRVSHVVRDKSRKGILLKPFEWNGEIPSDMLFVEGDNPLSYDSKYFGFIHKDNIKGVVISYL